MPVFGVVTAITSAIVGAVVSIIKELIFNVTLLLEVSVTIIVQSEQVHSLNRKLILLTNLNQFLINLLL